MEFILIIIAIAGFIHLSNRIGNLEKKLKANVLAVPQQNPISLNQTPPTAPLISPQVLPQAIKTEPEPIISSEEAGGRWLGKLGIGAVFIGVSFFLKYAFDNNIIGIFGRVLLGILVGAVLIGVGHYLRKKYQGYSDVLIGGGIGIFYLTIYSSFAFYHLIDQTGAFFFIALITVGSVLLSVLEDAPTIAIIATVGGFLTPLLFNIKADSFFILFTYILILDLGVLAVSFKKKWTHLLAITFFGTLFCVFIWCSEYYNETWLPVVMVFVTLYFFIFLGATFIRHIYQKESATGGDLTLITINALGYFWFSYALLNHSYHDFMGGFALLLSMMYVLITAASYQANPEDKGLNFYLPGLACVFISLAIPIQFSGTWVSLAWLVESLALFVASFAARRSNYQIFGSVIYFFGIIKLFADYVFIVKSSTYIPVLNERFVLFAIAIIVAYAICYLYSKNIQGQVMGTDNKTILATFLVVANLLTIYILTTEISTVYTQTLGGVGADTVSLQNQSNTTISIVWTLYATVLIAVGFIKRTKTLRIFGLVFFFITALKVFLDVWSLGEIYRIISSIIFGSVALVASFLYAKYKHRINDMML